MRQYVLVELDPEGIIANWPRITPVYRKVITELKGRSKILILVKNIATSISLRCCNKPGKRSASQCKGSMQFTNDIPERYWMP